MGKKRKLLSPEECLERLRIAECIAWDIFDNINEIYTYGDNEFFRKEGTKEKAHKAIEAVQTLQNLLYELDN